MQQRYLAAIDTIGSKPLCVFFRPGKGITTGKGFNTFIARQLLTFFNEIYKRLDKDGEIYINLYHWEPEYLEAFYRYVETERIPHDVNEASIRVRKRRKWGE